MSYLQLMGGAVAPRTQGPRVARMRVRSIGFGDLGSRQTLRIMRRTVRAGLQDPQVIETAAELVRGAPARDKADQARRIRNWMVTRTKYLNDPPGLELVRTPEYMLDRIRRDGIVQGDCDDMSVLAAALGLAAGMRARFLAVGFDERGPLQHVYTELLTQDGWKEMDVTRPLGRALATTKRTLPLEV